MKIGVISDTHIPVASEHLPYVLKEYFKNVDMIIHAGDIVEQSVLDNLYEYCPNVEAVCGNMDCAQLQGRLPQKKIIKAGKFIIGITHGWGPPMGITDRIRKEFKNVDIIVFGHTHKSMNERKNGILFFNPGSATDMISSERTIGIIELNEKINSRIIAI
ncbi:MAG: metallophosphatase family protein [Candidatus Omnitrophica bacterium]|nr:metallophosphatase family protein [Candidatus Omnitrophota bacterium]